jgi:hypothetical protein
MLHGEVHGIRARKNYPKWYKYVRGESSTEGGMSRTAGKIAHLRKSAFEHPEYMDVPMEAEDFSTLHLDLPAGKEGFERGK